MSTIPRAFYPCRSATHRRSRTQAVPNTTDATNFANDASSSVVAVNLAAAPAVLYRMADDGNYFNVANPTIKLSATEYQALTQRALRSDGFADTDVQLLCEGSSASGTCPITRPLKSSSDSSATGDLSSGVCTEACDTVSLSARSASSAEATSASAISVSAMTMNQDDDEHAIKKRPVVRQHATGSTSSRERAYMALSLPVRRVQDNEFAELARTSKGSVFLDPFTCAPFVVDSKTQHRCYSTKSVARTYKTDEIQHQYELEFGKQMSI